MTAPTFKLNIVKGKTLKQTLLYADTTLKYKPIVAQVSTAPVRFTVTTHGIPDGWPVRIQGVTAPTELNTEDGASVAAYTVDANTVEINALDSSAWGAFTVSGHLVFSAPADLTGWKLRMQVRDKIGGIVLLTLSSDPTDMPDGEIELDVPGSAFTLKLSAEKSAALAWSSGVYDIEAVLPDGSVIGVISPSPVLVSQEVTVWA